MAVALVIMTLPEPPAPGLVGAETSAWERGGGRHKLSPVPAWIEQPGDWRILSSEELSAWDDTGQALAGSIGNIVLATSDTNSIATASGIAVLVDGGVSDAAPLTFLRTQGPALAAARLVVTQPPVALRYGGHEGAEMRGRVTVPGRLGTRTAEARMVVLDIGGRKLLATSIIKPDGDAAARIEAMLTSISEF